MIPNRTSPPWSKPTTRREGRARRETPPHRSPRTHAYAETGRRADRVQASELKIHTREVAGWRPSPVRLGEPRSRRPGDRMDPDPQSIGRTTSRLACGEGITTDSAKPLSPHEARRARKRRIFARRIAVFRVRSHMREEARSGAPRRTIHNPRSHAHIEAEHRPRRVQSGKLRIRARGDVAEPQPGAIGRAEKPRGYGDWIFSNTASPISLREDKRLRSRGIIARRIAVFLERNKTCEKVGRPLRFNRKYREAARAEAVRLPDHFRSGEPRSHDCGEVASFPNRVRAEVPRIRLRAEIGHRRQDPIQLGMPRCGSRAETRPRLASVQSGVPRNPALEENGEREPTGSTSASTKPRARGKRAPAPSGAAKIRRDHVPNVA